MNTLKKSVILAVYLLINACATREWINPHVSMEQQMQDKVRCREYGMQALMAQGQQGMGLASAWIEVRAEMECMQMLGYTLQ